MGALPAAQATTEAGESPSTRRWSALLLLADPPAVPCLCASFPVLFSTWPVFDHPGPLACHWRRAHWASRPMPDRASTCGVWGPGDRGNVPDHPTQAVVGGP